MSELCRLFHIFTAHLTIRPGVLSVVIKTARTRHIPTRSNGFSHPITTIRRDICNIKNPCVVCKGKKCHRRPFGILYIYFSKSANVISSVFITRNIVVIHKHRSSPAAVRRLLLLNVVASNPQCRAKPEHDIPCDAAILSIADHIISIVITCPPGFILIYTRNQRLYSYYS